MISAWLQNFNGINQLLRRPFLSSLYFVLVFSPTSMGQELKGFVPSSNPEMASQTCDENMRIKSFFYDIIKEADKNSCDIIFFRQIANVGDVVVIQNIQYFWHALASVMFFWVNVANLSKIEQCLSQCSICFLSNRRVHRLHKRFLLWAIFFRCS